MAGTQRPTNYKALIRLLVVTFIVVAPTMLGKQNAFELPEIVLPSWLGWSIWGSGFVLGWLGLRDAFAGEVRSTQIIGSALFASLFGLALLFAAIQYRTEMANLVNTMPHRTRVTFVKLIKPESTGYRRDLFGPRCPLEFSLLDERRFEKSLCVQGMLLAPIPTEPAAYCKDQTLELRGRISSLGFAVDSIHAVTTCRDDG